MLKSDSIAALADALSKAQGEMEGAKKDSDNPFFKSKYADLSEVWRACRSQLSKYGLSVVQLPETSDSKIVVNTILMHSSGEWISGELEMTPVKGDPQGVGSCITYARRYALSAAVGIAPEDDDGNAASGQQKDVQRTTKPTPIIRPRAETSSAGTTVKGTGGIEATPQPPSSPADDHVPALADAITKVLTPDETIDLPKQKRLHRAFREAIPTSVSESTRKNAEVIFREWLSHEGFRDSENKGTTKTVPVYLFDEVLANAEKFAGTLR